MKLKKVLSAILAAAMVLSTMSFTVFANTADVIIDGTDYTVTTVAELEEAIANAKTSVVINGGDYSNGSYDYSNMSVVNGLEIKTNADVTINGGTFKAWTALHVTDSNVTINGGTFLASHAALRITNSSAKINGGTLEGTVPIYFDGNSNVSITDGTLASKYHTFYTDTDSSKLTFEISGGKIEMTGSSSTLTTGGQYDGTITDGTFSIADDDAAEELNKYVDGAYEFTKNDSGNYILAEKPVAKVNGVGYDTLIEAIEAASDNDTIDLCKDFVIDGEANTDYELPAGSTLDLGGNTLGVAATSAIFKGNNITIKNGEILSPSSDIKQNYTLYIGNESKVTVDNVKTYGINISVDSEVVLNNVTAHIQKNKYYAVYAGAGTILSITGDNGYYRSGYSSAKDVYAKDATVEISGGFFYYADSVEEFLADGYQLVRNKHNNGTVKMAHKVTFDANGGENAMDAIIIVNGESAVIAANAFTKTGYEFDGWNTSIDGTGEAYADGATVTPNADVTLYAQWKAAEYNITYELNGGTNDTAAPAKHTYGTATTLLEATLTGKTFAGWYTDSALTSASRVTQLDAEAYTANITLYAKWVDEATITSGIEVRFEQDTTDADGRTYNIVLASDSVLPFNRLTAADLTFKIENDTTDRTDVSYKIVAKEGTYITVNDVVTDTLGSTRTEFHYNGEDEADSGKADSIIIGQVKFEGYGAFTFGIDESDMTVVKTLAVQGTTEEDNIVTPYEFYGIDKTLIVNNDVPAGKGVIDTALETKKQTLTINVAFNNEINGGSSVAYKGMKYTISGGDLENVISGTFKVLDGKADSVVIANELSQFESYTVTLEAAGYRTAKYTVNMQDKDKELYFWNNVKDDINAMTIEKDASETLKVTKNFLAGDIVKDSKINIYDLSAVVSYFGTNTDEKPEYAKYDLNRDRIIDSTDVAMVLVSWGE